MKAIAYYRVSTQKQGDSGLGLEAQQEAVNRWSKRCDTEVVNFYMEVESGKRSDRPELTKAIAHAKAIKGTLVVAKLDRLARNVAFLSSLMEKGLDFVCCDMPDANRLTIHILAAVAEDEAKRISERTRAALAALKARGVKLGTPGNLSPAAQRKGSDMGVAAKRAKAIEAYEYVSPICHDLRTAGQSLKAIAEHLTAEGLTTRTGKSWSPTQVMRVLAMAP